MRQQINLFNPIFAKKKVRLSAVRMVQIYGVITVIFASLIGYQIYQNKNLQAQINAKASERLVHAARLGQLRTAYASRPKDETIEQEIARKETQAKSFQHILDILRKNTAGNGVGYAAYFVAFARQIRDGIWLKTMAITDSGTDISISGRALRPDLVPAYVDRLKTEPIMQGKYFSVLDMHTPAITSSKYIEFSLSSTSASQDLTAAKKEGEK